MVKYMEKIEVSCQSCQADFIINHDLYSPYKVQYCPFCGDMLDDEDLEIADHYQDEEFESYDKYSEYHDYDSEENEDFEDSYDDID